MRTTVTLDADVAAKLKQIAREQGISFKEALNVNVRRGLQRGSEGTARPYRLKSRRLEARPGIDLDRALSLADKLEDAEIARRLALRK